MVNMNPEAQDEIAREIGPSERLIWAGRPGQGFIFKPRDLYEVPLGLIFGYFVFNAGQSTFASDVKLFAIAIVGWMLVALFYMTIGRFFEDACKRTRTYYGLTSERAIIVSRFWRLYIRSVPLRRLPEQIGGGDQHPPGIPDD